MELERVEQLARRGTVSTLQIQKLFNDVVEKATGDTILTPSVKKSLKDWLTNVKAKNSVGTAERYGHTVDLFLKYLADNRAHRAARAAARRAFLSDNNQYILPEVFVQTMGEEFVVTTNNEQIPHLRISNTYKDLMAQSGNSAEVLITSAKKSARASF